MSYDIKVTAGESVVISAYPTYLPIGTYVIFTMLQKGPNIFSWCRIYVTYLFVVITN